MVVRILKAVDQLFEFKKLLGAGEVGVAETDELRAESQYAEGKDRVEDRKHSIVHFAPNVRGVVVLLQRGSGAPTALDPLLFSSVRKEKVSWVSARSGWGGRRRKKNEREERNAREERALDVRTQCSAVHGREGVREGGHMHAACAHAPALPAASSNVSACTSPGRCPSRAAYSRA